MCRYHSGTLENNEINWDINKKELKAVKNALEKFEIYAVYKKFILRIDNSTVKGWLTNKLSETIV